MKVGVVWENTYHEGDPVDGIQRTFYRDLSSGKRLRQLTAKLIILRWVLGHLPQAGEKALDGTCRHGFAMLPGTKGCAMHM